MSTKTLVAFAGLAVLVAVGCGQKDAPDADSSTGGSNAGSAGSSATGGSAGTGTGGAGNGPAITTAPPDWVRPADCGGIGDRCESLVGCGPLSVCQLEGYVCIPKLAEGATMLPGKTAEHPYCAAYTCMTFEEASCFCTGAAGTSTPSCSSPGALAGLCTGFDGSCATRACCDALTCVDLGTSKVCKQGCTTATDCASGCCTDLYDTGVLVCAELDACTNPCKRRAEACTPGSSTTPNDCCRGSCVESTNPEYAGCRPNCTTSAQCDTGCCVPFSNSTSGFCAAAQFCSCGAEAAACGPNSPACCEGTTCAGQSGTDIFTCRRVCTTAADCPGTQCRALSDNSASVCDAACSPLNTACGPDSLNCCAGMTCAGSEANGFTCRKSCNVPSDCPSGVCEILSDGAGICIE
ncbi:MAG TPA: hypothetical protein VMS65_15905 [Polyangiaceae bacterium]|nr:hypothetical protein [Polyangiaceae bacterium]